MALTITEAIEEGTARYRRLNPIPVPRFYHNMFKNMQTPAVKEQMTQAWNDADVYDPKFRYGLNFIVMSDEFPDFEEVVAWLAKSVAYENFDPAGDRSMGRPQPTVEGWITPFWFFTRIGS